MKKASAVADASARFDSYWLRPECKFSAGIRGSGRKLFDTRQTRIMRSLARRNGIQLISLRNKTSAEKNDESDFKVTGCKGNKFLHNDMKMYVSLVF